MFFHKILHQVIFHQHHYCRQMPRLYSNFECILKLHKSTLCVFFQDFILETIITKFTIWSFFKCFQIWWILFLHFMVYDNNILSKGSYSILFPMIYCMWWFCVFLVANLDVNGLFEVDEMIPRILLQMMKMLIKLFCVPLVWFCVTIYFFGRKWSYFYSTLSSNASITSSLSI